MDSSFQGLVNYTANVFRTINHYCRKLYTDFLYEPWAKFMFNLTAIVWIVPYTFLLVNIFFYFLTLSQTLMSLTDTNVAKQL